MSKVCLKRLIKMEKSCCCVFCLKNYTKVNDGSERNKKEEEFSLFDKFMKLLERYIATDCSNYDGSKSFKLFNNVFKSGPFTVCEKCLKSVHSFCALYQDLETIKLLLNLQLWNLNSVINGSEGSSNDLKTIWRLWKPPAPAVNELDSDILLERLIICRKDFSEKCSEKLLGSYPKLKIEKLPHSQILQEAPSSIENTGESMDHPNGLKSPVIVLPGGISVEQQGLGDLQHSTESESDLECETHDAPPQVTTEVEGEQEATREEWNDQQDEDYKEQNESDNLSSSEDEGHNRQNRKRKAEGSWSASPPPKAIYRGYRSLKCPCCPKIFSKNVHLKDHIALNHPEKLDSADMGFENCRTPVKFRFKCPDCEVMFKEVHSLLLHYREAHKIESSERSNLTVEILQFAVRKRAQFCTPLLAEGKRSVFDRIEIPSLEASTEVKICQADRCNRVFYSQAELETHSKLHGSFACEFCPEKMDFLPKLSMHEVRAHGVLKKSSGHGECKRCGEPFREIPNYLRHHASAHFGLDFSEHSCPICKTYLDSYEKFRYTSKISEKDSKSPALSRLFDHIKNVHGLDYIKTKKRTVVVRCSEGDCSAYFGSPLALAHHLKADHQLGIGSEESRAERKIQVCEECGKRCKSKESFQRHLLSHSGPASWEFTCEVCAKKCMTKTKLEEHLRVHTKEKPFVCEVCGVKYAHRHNLRIHVKNKHGV